MARNWRLQDLEDPIVIDVLVDGRPVRARTTGVARIITSLVNLMKSDGRLRFHVVGARNCAEHWPQPAGISFIHAGPRVGPKAGRRLIFEQHRLRKIIRRVRPDVYWATWDYGVPWSPPCPAVLTVHDLIPLRYSRRRWTLNDMAYKLNLRLAVAGATSIVADSEATRDELTEHCRVQRDQVTVIPPGVGEEFHSRQCLTDPDFGARAPFVLYVGGHAPRKNFHSLLLAFEHLFQCGRLGQLALVATGSEEKLAPDSRLVYSRLQPHRIVRFVGTVPNEALPALYRQATVFVFPSFAEGFGFPPLEAMACGVPVVCGRFDSLPEVVGEAAHLVDVRDPAEIAAAITRIVGDPAYAAALRQAGLVQAAKFRWSDSAARMADVLLNVARRGNR
jgi:glycosyltransferase involved in cell wall biosynthesis